MQKWTDIVPVILEELKDNKVNTFLFELYLSSLSKPILHQALLKALASVSPEPNYFKPLRHIYKAAEQRDDIEMWGLLSFLFESYQTKLVTGINGKWEYINERWQRINPYIGGRGHTPSGRYAYVNMASESLEENAQLAFSQKTKVYFSRRLMRSLIRLGDVGSTYYTRLAHSVLIFMDDEKHKKSPYQDVKYRYYRDENTGRWQSSRTITHYDEFAKYLAFNTILYGNSKRYKYHNNKAWIFTEGYSPDNRQVPDSREEAFPSLWDKEPDLLINLLCHSRCERVHLFAGRALKDNDNLLNHITIEHIKLFLRQKYNSTNELAIELAKQKHNPQAPDLALTEALLNCQLSNAHELALAWIAQNRDFYYGNSHFVLSLILSPYTDVREWIKKDLSGTGLADEQTQIVVGKSISHLLALDANSLENNEYAKGVSDVLLACFPAYFKNIGLAVINDLLNHPLEELQVFAANILLQHNTKVEDFPDDIILSLQQSPVARVRALGIELFGQLPDEVLLKKRTAIAGFSLSPIADVRKSIRPTICRLAQKDEDFAHYIIKQNLMALRMREAYKGLHDDIKILLTHESMAAHLNILDANTVWKLIRSKKVAAQAVGYTYINEHLSPADLNMEAWVELGKHDMRDFREWTWKAYENNVARIKYEREEATRLLDAEWEDSREFAKDFFANHFTKEDWTPELLISICDSTRPDIQDYGIKLIKSFFEERHGQDYLLKLCRHPSAKMQYLATGFLLQYVKNNTKGLQEMELFFQTVLSQINKGRKAKNAVYDFLQQEAINSEAVAKIVTRILNRLSATVAVGDKAKCIEILRDIQVKYPHLETKVKIIKPANR